MLAGGVAKTVIVRKKIHELAVDSGAGAKLDLLRNGTEIVHE